MNRYIGKISSVRDIPVIYFILMGNYLYIGETEDHPVVRWGAHLGNFGTFIEKIKHVDINALSKNEPIGFWAFECSYIKENIMSIQTTEAVKLTEYYLHALIKSSINTVRKQIGVNIEIVSDVSTTTPKYYRNNKCEDLAKSILDDFLNL